MSELRLILLVAGLALMIGIYFWGLRQRAGARHGRTVDGSGESLRAAAAETTQAGVGESRFTSADTVERSFADPAVEEEDIETPAIERLGTARREPTFGVRVEPEVQPVLEIRADTGREGLVGTDAMGGPITRPEAVRAAPALRDVTLTTAEQRPAPAVNRAADESGPVEASPVQPEAGAKPAQKIVALRIVAPADAKFSGLAVRQAFATEQLQFGRYDIFHRLHSDGRPVFSVASQKEPGTFDPATMDSTSLSGIALFTVLPGPLPPLDAFDQLVYAARSLSARLGGAIADERGTPISLQRISRMREDVLAFETRLSGAAG